MYVNIISLLNLFSEVNCRLIKGPGIGLWLRRRHVSWAWGVVLNAWGRSLSFACQRRYIDPGGAPAMGQQAQFVHHQPLSIWIQWASEGRELLSIKQCADHYWFAAKQKNTVINRSGWLHRPLAQLNEGTALWPHRASNPVFLFDPITRAWWACLSPRRMQQSDAPNHSPRQVSRGIIYSAASYARLPVATGHL